MEKISFELINQKSKNRTLIWKSVNPEEIDDLPFLTASSEIHKSEMGILTFFIVSRPRFDHTGSNHRKHTLYATFDNYFFPIDSKVFELESLYDFVIRK